MDNALEQVTTVIEQFNGGLMAVEDLMQDVLEITSHSRSNVDGTLPDALDALLAMEEWPDLLHVIVEGVHDGRAGRYRQPLGEPDPYLAVLTRVQEKILKAVDDPMSRPQAIVAVTRMSKQMLANHSFFEMFFAKLATLDLSVTERLKVNRELYQTASQYAGRTRANLELVYPYLDEPSVLDLLVHIAIQEERLPLGDELTQIREGLENLSTKQLTKLGAVFALNNEDDDAVKCARLALSREDIAVHDRYLMAFTLWISGEEREGMDVLAASPYDPRAGNWHTSARESLALYLLAREVSAESALALLTKHRGGWAKRSVTTVGALSGRFAYMRMRAYLALGDDEWAGREAYAVMKYHHARHYALHMQTKNQEFPVALVDRMAVTADELREARQVFAANSFDTDRSMILAEGTIHFRDLNAPW